MKIRVKLREKIYCRKCGKQIDDTRWIDIWNKSNMTIPIICVPCAVLKVGLKG